MVLGQSLPTPKRSLQPPLRLVCPRHKPFIFHPKKTYKLTEGWVSQEFDCQIPYRRARLLAANIGSEAIWQEKLISSIEGTEQEQGENMDFNDSPQEAKFREEVRTG